MKKKHLPRQLVTFEPGSRDEEVAVLGQLGQSNRFIKLETGLSDHQIHYRLKKAKDNSPDRIANMPGGFRTMWRNGNSPFFQRIYRDYAAVMRADIQKNIVPRIEYPTAETIKVPA